MGIVKGIAQSFDVRMQVGGIKDVRRFSSAHLGKGGSVHIFHRYCRCIIVPLKVVDPHNIVVVQMET
jgi:hypothetical protein